ncbi:hypothetical protein GCM10010218_05440 [Streptomyces mashuensis]|uniref:Uncharacterized protein n=1 Tax=Streptomyces mashuensis TaxID=33904 RepID=A0A919AVL6_9ACTN|nr:hypothetical protein [Streptomyces mashuensis]GHF27399.1 hypothetical protein GCM10010218_05440 [Streptomyces mashuensis]
MNTPDLHLPDLFAQDFRLDGYTLATGSDEDHFLGLVTDHDDLTPLIAHHTPDGARSYLVLHDGAAIWDVPGTAQLIAVVVSRDLGSQTLCFESERHPVLPLAQRWLIAHGAVPDAVRLPAQWGGPKPTDTLTSVLEEQLLTSGDRYEVLDHYTGDCGEYETYVLVHDKDPASAGQPYRLFLEQMASASDTYTLREGAFRTEDGAREWMAERGGPLPAPHMVPGALAVPRTQAARAATRRTSCPSPAPWPPAAPLPPAPGPGRHR